MESPSKLWQGFYQLRKGKEKGLTDKVLLLTAHMEALVQTQNFRSSQAPPQSERHAPSSSRFSWPTSFKRNIHRSPRWTVSASPSCLWRDGESRCSLPPCAQKEKLPVSRSGSLRVSHTFAYRQLTTRAWVSPANHSRVPDPPANHSRPPTPP